MMGFKPQIRRTVEKALQGDDGAVCDLLAALYPQACRTQADGASTSIARLVETVRRVSLMSHLPPLPARTLVRDVRVIDVRTGLRGPPCTVTITGERITGVSAEPALGAQPGDQIVEAAGLFMIPGLVDAHVHYVDPESYALQVAHGVTFVRDMGGYGDYILALREQLNRGAMLGPDMICTGMILDGDPPVWPFSVVCLNAGQGREAVRRMAAAGADQIKVYSRLLEEPYRAIVAAAHDAGLKAVGHIPESVPLDAALAAGQDSNEHLTGLGRAAAKLGGRTADLPHTFAGGLRAWEHFPDADQARLDDLLARIRAAGMVQCPTLVVIQGMARGAESDRCPDPRMEWVAPHALAFWEKRSQELAAPAVAALPHMQALIARLYQAGIPLMCGTDLANAHVYAGSSLHDEMKLLQRCGVPPAGVLKAATLTAAEFCGVADRLGTVEPGKMASLVLLEADPLRDVGNAARIAAVFLKGRCFTRAALDGLLTAVRNRVQAMRAAHACAGAGRA